MRICAYCESVVPDDTFTCPHCSSTSFREMCPRCGSTYEGTVCPACKAADDSAFAERVEQQAQAAAEEKANQGLVWKTVLTVFLPCVGGFFLIKENVRQGFRVFGIIWCILMAMATGGSAESSPTVRVLASLLCLAPIAYYLYKSRGRIFGRNDSRRRTPFVVLGAVLAFVMIGDVAIAAAGVGFPIVGDSNVKAAMVGGGASSSDSAESSSGASVSAADVKLAPVTEFLEYSNKDVDPVTLVTCNPSAQLTAKSKINLDTVGVQQVEYAVKVEDDSATFKVDFTVRDTKAPTINLSNSNLSIDQYADFDPAGSIASVSDVVDGALARVEAEPVARGASPGNEVFYDAGWYVIDGNVDPSAPGTYSLIVKAADKHGNVTTRELLVTVNEAAPVVAEEPAPAPAVHTYIANANTRKFHIPGCRDVAKMKDSNKVEITATRQEMLEWGYSPCGHCCP